MHRYLSHNFDIFVNENGFFNWHLPLNNYRSIYDFLDDAIVQIMVEVLVLVLVDAVIAIEEGLGG